MYAKSAEKIAKECENLDGEAGRQAIRFAFLAQDDSKLWPICGKFNATKRAIKKTHWFENQTGQYLEGLEYALMIEKCMSLVVNGEV